MSETNENQNVRPTFLTVLCILTFIGSGLGLLGSILGLIGSTALSMFAPEGSIIVQLLSLIASGLGLFGAVKMWGLYKQGFMIYTLGSVIGIIGSIISAVTIKSYVEKTMSTMSELQGLDSSTNAFANDFAVAAASTAAWTGVVTTVIFSGLFIILYAVNRKHLTK